MTFTTLTLPFCNIPLSISHYAFSALTCAVGQQLLNEYMPTDFYAWKPVRRSSFLAGRAAVKQWQKVFAETSFIVPKAVDGSPHWPDGWLGSISHCTDEAIAVLYFQREDIQPKALLGLGVDVEYLSQAKQLKATEDLLCVASERLLIRDQGYDLESELLVLFSIKESIYKAIYPSLRRFVDFLEVEVILLNSQGHWCARPRAALAKELDQKCELFGVFWQKQGKCYSVCGWV
ncbi:4'-phosphopantetheinyl transferase family protein [Marinomonas ostreistagni]|uniref:4'-phosphopantetheinyl transferase family protein n=1 Tax=Marinomonas ostreistagni TaxID=359209 RepID=UPI00194F06AF|nr:4'-phosphopantetheinyl transferase superfamily protein [Marinomonas ostreistagni]MBM6549493.1 4'-phosphopantetheinyl transferase superfamily protein [Marinomonas ostreistagni]